MTNQTMEELCDDYFASMNPIANKIIEEKRKCKEKNRKNWERLTQAEKDSLLDEWFIDPDLKIRYEIRLQGQLPTNKDAPPESFPRLNLQGGTKTVQYTEHEDGSQSKGNCQQEQPMMSPGSITAHSTRNGGLEYPENRFSLGLDANDESQLIVNSAKSKGKEGKRAPDPAEKPDKTKLSRKDSKKEERAKERAREKENHKQETPVSIVQQQPKVCQSPLADMNQIMMDKNAKGPKKEKSEKAKSPKTPRGRGSGRASPKREGKKDKSFDLEGLLPAADPKEDRSVGGLHFSLSGMETTESDGLLSSTSPTVGRSSGLSGSMQQSTVPSPPMQHSTVPSSPPPSSPPASAASAESDQASASEGGGAAGKEEGAAFDFLLAW